MYNRTAAIWTSILILASSWQASAQENRLTFSPASPPPQEQAFKDALASIVMVQIPLQDNQQREGTAFAVKDSGLLLTNYHVVAGQKTVPVSLREYPYRSFSTLVIAADPARDLAALKLVDERVSLVGLEIAPDENWIQPSVEVFSVGFTSGRDPWGFLSGRITSITDRAAAIYVLRQKSSDHKTAFSMNRMVLVDMTPTPGHSGGPLLAKSDGSVVGMVTRAEFEKFEGPDGAQIIAGGKTACIPYFEIRDFVKNLKDFSDLKRLPIAPQENGLVGIQPATPAIQAPQLAKRFAVYDSRAAAKEIDAQSYSQYSFIDLGPIVPGREYLENRIAGIISPSLLHSPPTAQYLGNDGLRMSFIAVQGATIKEELFVNDGLLETTIGIPNGITVHLDVSVAPLVFRQNPTNTLGDAVVKYRRNKLRLFLIGDDEDRLDDGVKRTRVRFTPVVNNTRLGDDRAVLNGPNPMVYRYRQYVSDDNSQSWLALYVLTTDRFIACHFKCPSAMALSQDAGERHKFDEAALTLLSVGVR